MQLEQKLKIGAIASFLLIVVPGSDSHTEIMAVFITAYFRDLFLGRSHHFNFFAILQVLYLVALIYLAAFSRSPKRATAIGVLIALGILWIPCLLIFFYLFFAGAYLNLATVTIALFSFFATRLVLFYRKRLMNST